MPPMLKTARWEFGGRMTLGELNETFAKLKAGARAMNDVELFQHHRQAERRIAKAQRKGVKPRYIWLHREAVYGGEIKKRQALP